MPTYRTGVLIIRAWAEPGSAEPLRAQVRVTGDISTGIERTMTCCRIDEVRKLVEAFIQGVLEAEPITPSAADQEVEVDLTLEEIPVDDSAS